VTENPCRVKVPSFEIVSNPTISISKVKEIHADFIERAIDVAFTAWAKEQVELDYMLSLLSNIEEKKE
jgi:hypothetical protein